MTARGPSRPHEQRTWSWRDSAIERDVPPPDNRGGHPSDAASAQIIGALDGWKQAGSSLARTEGWPPRLASRGGFVVEEIVMWREMAKQAAPQVVEICGALLQEGMKSWVRRRGSAVYDAHSAAAEPGDPPLRRRRAWRCASRSATRPKGSAARRRCARWRRAWPSSMKTSWKASGRWSPRM